MENKKISKFWITIILVGSIGLLSGMSLVYASSQHESSQISNLSSDQCYVSPEQMVVRWKSGFYQIFCRISVAGMCVWPISRGHVTYKVTVGNNIALRSEEGTVIAAVNGKMQKYWQTYDAISWNALHNDLSSVYEFYDYEPIGFNEYVVMVETRYRLFNNVESTIGICVLK